LQPLMTLQDLQITVRALTIQGPEIYVVITTACHDHKWGDRHTGNEILSSPASLPCPFGSIDKYSWIFELAGAEPASTGSWVVGRQVPYEYDAIRPSRDDPLAVTAERRAPDLVFMTFEYSRAVTRILGIQIPDPQLCVLVLQPIGAFGHDPTAVRADF